MNSKLAPSVQRAHVHVTRAWYVSLLHAVLLLGLGISLFLGDPPAWGWATLCLVGAGVVPTLGRAAYRGTSLAAAILLGTALVPAGAAWFLGWDLTLALVCALLVPPYALGVQGALGLRGKRRSKRSRSG